MGSVNAIFAADKTGGIGFNGSLPWSCQIDDMIWFKNHTVDQVVVMGRRTWDDPLMPKPLPNRINVVFSNYLINMAGVICLSGDFITKIRDLQTTFSHKDIYIIGGHSLLKEIKPVLDNLYLTIVDGTYNIDVSIDLPDYLNGFTQTESFRKGACVFNTYTRRENQK
jgi:dihydrofolate reductase